MIPQTRNTVQRLAAITLVGLLVGLISAFATSGFVEIVRRLNELLLVSGASRDGRDAVTLWWVTFAVLGGGGLAVGLILHYSGNRNGQAGPADSIFAVQLNERLPTPLAGAGTTLAAMLSLGCGASVGQYGPLVYLGTLIGQVTARLSLGLRDIRNITIACGVAAAISTAFNAPLAALIFTHEVILRHYSLRMFAAVTVASACGYLVANVVFDHPPLFLVEFGGGFDGLEFLWFGIEGIACGLLAVLFMQLLGLAGRAAERLPAPAPVKPMLAGMVLALVAQSTPEVLGAGQEVFRQAMAGGIYDAPALLVILLAKLAVTALCIGFGFAGGVIFPALLIGVLFGALFAELLPGQLLADYSGLQVYAICGMVAVVSPVIGAPITALLLVFELTRSYEITVAAMLTIVFANLFASYLYGRSLYDHQLAERGIDLSMGRERAFLMHRKVAALATDTSPVVDAGTPLEELRRVLADSGASFAVVVDDRQRFVGRIEQSRLLQADAAAGIDDLEPRKDDIFDQNTSIWQAIQVMRHRGDDAIVVVDSNSGRYLGSIAQASVINAYLDASQELRREEYEV